MIHMAAIAASLRLIMDVGFFFFLSSPPSPLLLVAIAMLMQKIEKCQTCKTELFPGAGARPRPPPPPPPRAPRANVPEQILCVLPGGGGGCGGVGVWLVGKREGLR